MNFDFEDFLTKRRSTYTEAIKALHQEGRAYVVMADILLVLEADLFAIASMLREWNVTIEEARTND